LVTVADDGAITAPVVGSMIPFYWAGPYTSSNPALFPQAASSHGAIAHSHADGAMYFAHSSYWIRLLDANTTVTIAQGGTNSTSTPTAGAVAYGTGTAFAFSTSGTAGQVFVSNGVSAPSWQDFSSAPSFLLFNAGVS